MRPFFVIVFLWTTVLNPMQLVAQRDPLLGTWRLNVGASKFPPDLNAPQSQLRIFEQAGDAIKYRSESIDASGTATTSSYTFRYDGKDYPVLGSRVSDTISVRRLSDRSWEIIEHKNGVVAGRSSRAVSDDGKRMTLTVIRTNASGEPANAVLVFDRER